MIQSRKKSFDNYGKLSPSRPEVLTGLGLRTYFVLQIASE